MEILVTGATGYIGRAVLARLLANGHEVSAVVRSDESAAAVKAAGAVALRGDLFDSDWIRKQLETVQAAIHTAAASDEKDEAMNAAVIDAVLEAFGGTDKPFIHTGGIWAYGPSADVTEDTPPQPPAITAWRVGGEQRLLDSDVRAAVVQPGIVYGQGGGVPSMVLGGPKDASGALTLVGSGDQHWTTVHVDDLADLYLRILDEGATGAVIGASGDNPTVRELGEAAGPVVPGSDEEAVGRFGPTFAEALLLDQQTAAAKARGLGWTPSRPTLVEQIRSGYTSAG